MYPFLWVSYNYLTTLYKIPLLKDPHQDITKLPKYIGVSLERPQIHNISQHRKVTLETLNFLSKKIFLESIMHSKLTLKLVCSWRCPWICSAAEDDLELLLLLLWSLYRVWCWGLSPGLCECWVQTLSIKSMPSPTFLNFNLRIR